MKLQSVVQDKYLRLLLTKKFKGIKGSSKGTRPEDEDDYWFEGENAIE